MSTGNKTLYKLYVPGIRPEQDKFTEDELRQYVKALGPEKAAEASVWRNGMDEYSPLWTEFEWAERFAPEPPLDGTEDKIRITWLGVPRQLGGEGKWNSYRISPICIPMVGASGVGKTSLLVSMYTQLPGAFLPDNEADHGTTHNIVDEKRVELAQLTEGKAGQPVTRPAGKGTEGRHCYYFRTAAVKDGNLYTQPFCFVDFAGGWFNGMNSAPEVLETLGKAPVSLLVVDTPALMGGGSHHELINRPGRIHDLYKMVVESWRHTPRAVVVVLLKAERFIHDRRVPEVVQTLRSRYKGLLELLYRHNVKIYVTPVETAGGVEFDHFTEDGEPRYRYTGAGYTPKDCEIPLKICLQRALNGRIHTLHRKLDNQAPSWRWIREKVCRSKERPALGVLTDFLRDSSLCDLDIRPYRLFSNPPSGK